jgi:linoleoyl-CoA desaturase
MQPIKFSAQKDLDFFITLRTRVQQYFDRTKQSKQGNPSLYLKMTILYIIYLGSFFAILFSGLPGWALLLLCVTMGIGACGLGLNVMHDALHNSFSKHKWLNKVIGYTMEILGGSSLTWKIQHNMMHHTFTNVYGMDEDIHDKPFLRLSPDGKLRGYHRYQHLYAPILYGLSNASWLVQKDFKQFIVYWRDGVLKKIGVQPVVAFLKLALGKVVYFGLIIALPILLLPFAWYWSIIGFLIVQFVSGILMTLIFLTAHAVGEVNHYQPDQDGNLENNWAMHQVRTTANFNTKSNPILHWFVGGLNHQIEHHLFPQISHVHYSALSPIVKQTAQEFGLEYMEYTSFGSAIASHFQYLRAIGRGEQVAIA